MLDAIRRFVHRNMAPTAETGGAISTSENLHVAACALLLELAHADGEFSDSERAHIESALGRHFALDPITARELIDLAVAERELSIDHFQFTRAINESYDQGQKMVLAEIMWGVILADGTIKDHETYLVRKLAHLLGLEPGYLAQARQEAADRQTPQKETP